MCRLYSFDLTTNLASTFLPREREFVKVAWPLITNPFFSFKRTTMSTDHNMPLTQRDGKRWHLISCSGFLKTPLEC